MKCIMTLLVAVLVVETAGRSLPFHDRRPTSLPLTKVIKMVDSRHESSTHAQQDTDTTPRSKLQRLAKTAIHTENELHRQPKAQTFTPTSLDSDQAETTIRTETKLHRELEFSSSAPASPADPMQTTQVPNIQTTVDSVREIGVLNGMDSDDLERENLIKKILFEVNLYRQWRRTHHNQQSEEEKEAGDNNDDDNNDDDDDYDNEDDDEVVNYSEDNDVKKASHHDSRANSRGQDNTRSPQAHRSIENEDSVTSEDVEDNVVDDTLEELNPDVLKDTAGKSDEALQQAMDQMSRESLEAMLAQLTRLRRGNATEASTSSLPTTASAKATDIAQLALGDICCSVG